MRKALLVLTLVLTMAAISRGEDTGGVVWQKETPPHPMFSASYRLYVFGRAEDCHVNMRADGQGVTIVSRLRKTDDHNNTFFIQQQLDIERPSKWRGPLKDDQRFATSVEQARGVVGFYIVSSQEFAIGPLHKDTGKPPKVPDVFRIGYLDTAKFLPPEVRKLFFGYDGVH